MEKGCRGCGTSVDLLMAHVPPAASAELRLLDEAGRPPAAARVIEDYIAASRGKPARAQLKRVRQMMPRMVDGFPETTEQLRRAA